MTLLDHDDREAARLVDAIRRRHDESLWQLLRSHPGLAMARISGDGGVRTPLHVATDWPGTSCPPATRGALGLTAAPDGGPGVHLDWIAWGDGLTTLDTAVGEGHDELAEWLRGLGAVSARA